MTAGLVTKFHVPEISATNKNTMRRK